MLYSKFDLYKAEWLDLIFKNRNQQYGAYEMRSHYGEVMLRAMAVTFFTVAMGAGAITIISHSKPLVPETKIINVVTADLPVTPPEKPKELPKQPKAAPAEVTKAVKVATQRFPPPVVVPDPKAEDIKGLDPKVAVASVDSKGPADGTMNVPIAENKTPGGGGIGNNVTEDNTPHDVVDLQILPEPVGGAGAWSKFLQKNLRYPPAAQEQAVSGKVFLSFIIEKDGHLSDITVIRKANYGFDEEALRVLKLAPAWKPGIQNGQPVRVRYTIPINFQISE